MDWWVAQATSRKGGESGGGDGDGKESEAVEGVLINVGGRNPRLRDEDEMEMRDSRICSCRGGGGDGGWWWWLWVEYWGGGMKVRLKASGPVSQTG